MKVRSGAPHKKLIRKKSGEKPQAEETPAPVSTQKARAHVYKTTGAPHSRSPLQQERLQRKADVAQKSLKDRGTSIPHGGQRGGIQTPAPTVA